MSKAADALVDLAEREYAQGNHREAEDLFRRAFATGRDDVDVLHFIGFLARARDDFDEAGKFYSLALTRNPTDAQLHNNLAEVRRAQQRNAEAVALYRRAIALGPDQAEIHANLGSFLVALHRPDEALPCLERALELRPDLAAIHNDAALAHCAFGRFAEAREHYLAVLAAQPSNANARYLESLALLALGDFARGWRRHEVRWYAELGRDKRRAFRQISWLGDTDLAGRSILLHAEQGIGDTLQFLRYVPRVAALGAKVFLEVHPPLKPLLQDMPDVAGVFGRDETLPAFETHCSFMSLPRAFRTEIATIPAEVPYLHVPAEHLARWRGRLGARDARRRIAFAWFGSAGGPWNRDMKLRSLLPLLDRADCVFHVAQIGLSDDDRAVLAGRCNVVDHSGDIADFADTAGLVSQMDLVLSVDTALAHLAGALALPAWTLLPLGSDYRWMSERTDTPWYPTMRLFRQKRLHDWAGVVEAVEAALDAPRHMLRHE